VTERRHHEPLPLGEGALPYSKGLLARALIATGLAAERAYQLAQRAEDDLAERGERALELERLDELARGALGEEEGRRAVRMLRRYRELQELDLPLIVLIGGGTGTGKSSVATEIAYRLGITRVTSTDFIRQTLRAFFSKEFMPSIHHSSFEAGEAVSASEEEAGDPRLLGFLEQTRNVLVGVRAVVDRALQEGFSMVLEGVHLVPGMLGPIDGALVVHCVLAIESEEEHATHFFVRDFASEGLRPVDRYLESLSDIRVIQDAIVERARRLRVPVVENSDLGRTIGSVMELVLTSTERLEVAAHGGPGG
jgi:2-phosphoglycerate kinase